MWTLIAILFVLVVFVIGCLIGGVVIKIITTGLGILKQKEREIEIRTKKMEKELQKEEEDNEFDFLRKRRFKDN